MFRPILPDIIWNKRTGKKVFAFSWAILYNAEFIWGEFAAGSDFLVMH